MALNYALKRISKLLIKPVVLKSAPEIEERPLSICLEIFYHSKLLSKLAPFFYSLSPVTKNCFNVLSNEPMKKVATETRKRKTIDNFVFN